MKNNKKCVESYFDSSKYNQEEIIKALSEDAKTYPNKKFEIDLSLNQWGVYVARVVFYNKRTLKNMALLKIKESKFQKNKISKREKYSGKTYGKYKATKSYKPCTY